MMMMMGGGGGAKLTSIYAKIKLSVYNYKDKDGLGVRKRINTTVKSTNQNSIHVLGTEVFTHDSIHQQSPVLVVFTNIDCQFNHINFPSSFKRARAASIITTHTL